MEVVEKLHFPHGEKRVYFTHGGKRVWFSSCLETPIILLPTSSAYFCRSRNQPSSQNKLFFMKPHLFLAATVIGIWSPLWPLKLKLHKFTSYPVNAVVLLTIGTGVLTMHTSGDRPQKESKREYVLGFLMTLVGVYFVHRRNHSSCFTTRNRDPGCHFFQPQFSCGEGIGSCTLTLGLPFLLLW
ncbi:hypothetical protein V6N11_043020 [Hibiscus sabdariffa]|uniref:Uncharacterized protein n=1 Tax=Hibiscus sabdariffa TaxID=183260 RepID=A0ABR2QY12_9ROSI